MLTGRPALSFAPPTFASSISFPDGTEKLDRKCGHDKKKQSYAVLMQPPPTPEEPNKPVKEPAGEAKGYEEIRARIGKGKK